MNVFSKKNTSEFIKNSFPDGSNDSDFGQEEKQNFFQRNYAKISNRISERKLSNDRTAKLIDLVSLSLERSEDAIIRSLEEKYNQRCLYNTSSANTMSSINIICCYRSFSPPITSLQTSSNNIQTPITSQQQQAIPYYGGNYLPNQMLPIPPQPIFPFNRHSTLFPLLSTKKKHKKSRKDDQKKHKKEDKKKIIKEFKYNSGQEFEGIFNYLYTKTNGNIHDNGTIEVTASSYNDQSGSKSFSSSSKTYQPKALLNGKGGSRGSRGTFNQTDFYGAAKNDNDFWIRFDFKNMKISITNYTIQNTRYANVSNIRNWVLEISKNGDKWDQIDTQNNCSFFQKSTTTHTFEVKETKFVRYVRFRHTGDKWSPSGSLDTNYIGIQAMEFFGKLKE